MPIFHVVACLLLPPFAQESSASPPRVPLAYVRRLAVAPVAQAARTDAPLPPRPPTPARKALLAWAQQREARVTFLRLRAEMLKALDAALSTRLARRAGLTLASAGEGDIPLGWANVRAAPAETGVRWVIGRNVEGRLVPAVSDLEAFARARQANAALTAALDRFHVHAGIERVLWLRLTAYLLPIEGDRARGPFYVYGRASALRHILEKGYQKRDSRLAQEAAVQAARQLAHLLETGEEPPFAREVRIAVVPAALPEEVEKRAANREGTRATPAASLKRQSDVLLQVDAGPVVEQADIRDVRDAVRALHLQPRDFWTDDGLPNVERARMLAERLEADYLFLSRVTDLRLSEQPVVVRDGRQPREGVERHAEAEAEALLLRVEDGAILWRDQQSGSTTARTEYVRQRPRLRTDEQCTVDAARVAYAYLRVSFEDYKRKFER